MPKKFAGENTKSAIAKARKEEVRKTAEEKKKKEEEDKLWEDNDKHVLRKQERKEDKEKKEAERLQRKQEAQRLLDEEMATLKSAKPSASKPDKVTRYEIELHKEREQAEREKAAAAASKDRSLVVSSDSEIEENVNRLQLDHEHARNLDEALEVLGATDKTLDHHPEKRMRAAYLEFEEENLPRLKQENPNMRLSQLKQLLKKDWMKSPKNPLIQNVLNAK